MTAPAEGDRAAEGRTPSDRELPATSKRAIRAGTLLFWIVLFGLVSTGGLPWPDAILLACLLVVLPLLSLAQLPLVRGLEIERRSAYWSSIVTLAAIGGITWLVGARRGPEALGLVPLGTPALLGWSLGMATAGLGVIVLFRLVTPALGLRESDMLRHLLPRTPSDRALFALLSVAAGTAEELAFRGYAIPLLAPTLGAGGAVALTSLVFGAMHGYQGAVGMARTATMGAILAVGFLLSGSLWPSVLAHTAIDVVAGIMLGERLLPPAPRVGVSQLDTDHRTP